MPFPPFFKKLIIIGLLMNIIFGCNESEIPTFTNKTISDFRSKDYSFLSPGIEKYRVDDVIVIPNFSPSEGYDFFDVGVSLYSKQKGDSIEVLRIFIPGIGEIFSGSVNLETKSELKNSGVFNEHKIIADKINAKTLVEKMPPDEKSIDLLLSFRKNDELVEIKYRFYLEMKKIAAPIR